MTTLPRATSRK